MCFNTRGEISFSLRGHVISSIYSSSKLKTKLEVNSRYQDILKIPRSSPVSFREIAETSRKVTSLHAQSSPDTGASFHDYFSQLEPPWVAVAQSANPQLRLFSDLTGHTDESVQTPRKSKRMNQRNRRDLEISRTNSALTSSNSRIKPKTYKLCVPNLAKKWQL